MIVTEIASNSRHCRDFGQGNTEGEMQWCIHVSLLQQINETSFLEDLIQISCGLSVLIWKFHAMLDCTGICEQKRHAMFRGKLKHTCLG